MAEYTVGDPASALARQYKISKTAALELVTRAAARRRSAWCAGIAAVISDFEPSLRELATSLGDGVRIMTMGMSKGLTLNTVVVAGVDSGTMPAPRGKSMKSCGSCTSRSREPPR